MSSSFANHDECSNDGSQPSPRISNAFPFVNGLFLGSLPPIQTSPPAASIDPTTQDVGPILLSNLAGSSSDSDYPETSVAFMDSAPLFSEFAFSGIFPNHQAPTPPSAAGQIAPWESAPIPSWAALFSPDLTLASSSHSCVHNPQYDRDGHTTLDRLPVAHTDQHFSAFSGMSHLSSQPSSSSANQLVHSFNPSLGSSLPHSVASFGSGPAASSASHLAPIAQSQSMSSATQPRVDPEIARHSTFPPCNSDPGSLAPGHMPLSPLDDIFMSASVPGAIEQATMELPIPVQHVPNRSRPRPSANIDPAIIDLLPVDSQSPTTKRSRTSSSHDSPSRASAPLDGSFVMSISPTYWPASAAPPFSSVSSAAITPLTGMLAAVATDACSAVEVTEFSSNLAQLSPTFAQLTASPIPTCPSTITSPSAPSPVPAVTELPFPSAITPAARPGTVDSVHSPGRELTVAPGGVEMMLGVTSIAIGGEGGEEALVTAEVKEPRFDGDLYTPRIVRGSGRQREAKCHFCDADKWLNLKTSAYWYHMQYYHGISSASGLPFFEPNERRWTASLAPSAAANGATSDGTLGTGLSPGQSRNSTSRTPPTPPPVVSTYPGVPLQTSNSSPTIIPSDPLFPLLGPLPNPHFTPPTLHPQRVRISVVIEESALCPHCNEWVTLSAVRRPSRYDLLARIMAAAGMPNVDIRNGLLPSEIAAAREVSVVLDEPPLGFAPTNCRGTGASSTWFRHAGRCIANDGKIVK